ncbi:MAG: carboxypeptidase-like regulatory domain-containing protein [Eubacterium sp.]
MKKKIISVILAICITVSCLSIPTVTFATMLSLSLDVKVSCQTDGAEDAIWYTFTPDISGTYSFLSYNIRGAVANLYTKEKDPQTGAKYYSWIASSNTSPNYNENGQSGILQFCLTHYLEAGTTYYFSACWSNESISSEAMTVMLRCDSYDEKVIDHIELSCEASLDAYTNGEWKKDSNAMPYFYYDASRIIANMNITVYYTNGNVSSVFGSDTIDGYDIMYTQTQTENHWYPQSTEDYVKNTLTVTILDASVDFDVPIVISALYSVKGTVLDFAGNPVENATITANNSVIAQTDSSGNFVCSTTAGSYKIYVSADNAVTREATMIVSAIYGSNDFTAMPIGIVTCDYVKDGIINAKDYSYMINNLTGDELDKQKAQYANAINFSKAAYEPLTIK